jgi:arabinofuranosyltransferase
LLAIAVVGKWRWFSGPLLVTSAGAAATGLLLIAYVTAIGGDFMHGRMLLPGMFAMLLPVMTVPWRQYARPLTVLLALWALVCVSMLRVPYRGHGPHMIEDSRDVYVGWSRQAHPTDARALYRGMLRTLPNLDTDLALARSAPVPQLIFSKSIRTPTAFWILGYPFHLAPLAYHAPESVGVVYGAIGMPGALLPVDGLVVDIFGLAYPLAGHMAVDFPIRAGHDKMIRVEWILADYTPATTKIVVKKVSEKQIDAARHALTCGAIAELQQSVRAPLTWDRFLDNVAGAFGRTNLRIPGDPVAAERQFCARH